MSLFTIIIFNFINYLISVLGVYLILVYLVKRFKENNNGHISMSLVNEQITHQNGKNMQSGDMWNEGRW